MRAMQGTLALLVLSAIGPAQAQQSIELGDTGARLLLRGQYRIQGTALNDFPIRAEDPWLFGLQEGSGLVADQRLRVAIELHKGSFHMGTEWDLFAGQLAGTPWATERSDDEQGRNVLGTVSAPSAFLPRRAAVFNHWQAMDLELGLITSQWGLGLLSNDGAQARLFGRNDLGDRILRARLTTRPLYATKTPSKARDRFLATVAVDLVAGDDAARLSQGQIGVEGVLSFVYLADPEGPLPGARVGTYMVYREQNQNDHRPTRVFVPDIHGLLPIKLGKDWGLDLELEAILIVGKSLRATSYGSPYSTTLASFGVGGELRLKAPTVFQLHLLGGLASGDPNPDDGVRSTFSMDRNAAPGLILFDNYLTGIDAGTYLNLTDPTRSPAPDGITGLNTEGSVKGAAYVFPVVQVQPMEVLTLRAGLLLATSMNDGANPYYSFRAGGVPRNHLDQPPGGRYLGTELDWAVEFGGSVAPSREDGPKLRLRVQGGHLFVGSALSGGGPAVVNELLLSGLWDW